MSGSAAERVAEGGGEGGGGERGTRCEREYARGEGAGERKRGDGRAKKAGTKGRDASKVI